MKKYLIKGALALFGGALMFSCAEKESEYVPVAQQKAKAFEDVFKEVYGDNIDPYQKWGFSDNMDIANGDTVEFEDLDDVAVGSRSRTRAGALTRGSLPSEPSFRDTNPMSKPTVSYSNSVPSDAISAAEDFGAGATIYIDEDYYESHDYWSPSVDGKDNLIIYVDGSVTFHGATSSNGNGTTICVTEGSTLTLGGVRTNLKVYLAPNATLNVPDWSSFQNPNGGLYLSSGSQVNGINLSFVGGAKVLNAGGTISATNLTLDQNCNLWNEGTITVTNTLTLTNTSSMLYNAAGKTISAGNIDLINNDALLYNDGTVNCTGTIKLHNSQAEVINNNSMSCAAYSQAAGGKTHNVGKVTVSGKTDLTNSNSDWMNECEWTTGSFDVDNYSSANINKGKLTVSGQFHLNRGTFVNDAGCLVTCASFLWEDTSDFYLGSKSKLEVSGTLTTNNYNSGYGFRGVGSDYAIISANEIAKGKGDVQFSMSYFGNLYISTSNHFAQGALDPANDPPAQPYYYYDSTVLFSFNDDACPVTFTAPTCGSTPPPHIPVSGSGSNSVVSSTDEDIWSQVTLQSGRVFCEDLGQATREDLDYNDVVFDVIIWSHKTKTTTITTTTTWTTSDGVEDPGSRSSTSSSRVTYSGENYYAQVTLLAAGGTLPLTVAGKEVHDAFGVGVTTMVNTVNDYSTVYGSYKTLSPVAIGDVTKTVKYNGVTQNIKLFSGYDKAINIPIVVNYNGVSVNELSANAGEAPHKLFVPLGTKWAVERKNLALAYPQFVNYVSDTSKNWTTDSSNDSYYMYTEGDTRGLAVMPAVIKNRRVSVKGKENNLWTGAQSFGTNWSLKNVSQTFTAHVLYPGDRLRFYGKGIGDEAWINVSINNEKPYLIDSDFPNYVFDTNNTKVMLGANEEGFVEILLDETTAAQLNNLIDHGYQFVIQGRNFTLTRIAVVEFD